jgi:hypothetical protein
MMVGWHLRALFHFEVGKHQVLTKGGPHPAAGQDVEWLDLFDIDERHG